MLLIRWCEAWTNDCIDSEFREKAFLQDFLGTTWRFKYSAFGFTRLPKADVRDKALYKDMEVLRTVSREGKIVSNDKKANNI